MLYENIECSVLPLSENKGKQEADQVIAGWNNQL